MRASPGTTFTDTLLNPSHHLQLHGEGGGFGEQPVGRVLEHRDDHDQLPRSRSTSYYRLVLGTTAFCVGTGATPPAVGSTLVLVNCDTTTQYQKWAFLQTLNSVTIGTSGQYFVAPDVASTPLTWDVPNTNLGTKADIVEGGEHASAVEADRRDRRHRSTS